MIRSRDIYKIFSQAGVKRSKCVLISSKLSGFIFSASQKIHQLEQEKLLSRHSQILKDFV